MSGWLSTQKQDPEILLMLTSKCIVFPISFCLVKQTYNDVLIAIYYHASYCFIFHGLWSLTRTKSNPMDKMYWRKDQYESYCRLLGPCFYSVIEGATKITSLTTGVLALQPDRHAITYCCGSTCWKVWVWVREAYHRETHRFSYPLTAFFASLHAAGCVMCL